MGFNAFGQAYFGQAAVTILAVIKKVFRSVTRGISGFHRSTKREL